MNKIKPIDFKQANKEITGANGIGDLPVHDDGVSMVSCWQISFRERLKILFRGRVYVAILGDLHPPIWLDTEGFEDG